MFSLEEILGGARRNMINTSSCLLSVRVLKLLDKMVLNRAFLVPIPEMRECHAKFRLSSGAVIILKVSVRGF